VEGDSHDGGAWLVLQLGVLLLLGALGRRMSVALLMPSCRDASRSMCMAPCPAPPVLTSMLFRMPSSAGSCLQGCCFHRSPWWPPRPRAGSACSTLMSPEGGEPALLGGPSPSANESPLPSMLDMLPTSPSLAGGLVGCPASAAAAATPLLLLPWLVCAKRLGLRAWPCCAPPPCACVVVWR